MNTFAIDDNTARILKQAAGLPEYNEDGMCAPVPDYICKMYERVLRRFNRVGGSTLSSESLAMIVAMAEMCEDLGLTAKIAPTEHFDDPKAAVANLFLSGKLKVGDRVMATYKSQTREAKLLDVRKDRSQIQVMIDDDDTARWLPMRNVRMIEMANA